MKKHKRKLTQRLTTGQPSVLCACDKMPEINCLQGEKVSEVEDQSSLTMWPWAYGGTIPLRGRCGRGLFTA